MPVRTGADALLTSSVRTDWLGWRALFILVDDGQRNTVSALMYWVSGDVYKGQVDKATGSYAGLYPHDATARIVGRAVYGTSGQLELPGPPFVGSFQFAA